SAVMRKLTKPLGLTDFAINHYELEPGDSFAFAYHNHAVQEEAFVVIEGTAVFDTEAGPIEVGPGEAVRFDRGEFQRGWNHGDERVVALALGAPLDYGKQVKLRDCPTCGEMTDNRLERVEDGGEEIVVAECTECGAETGRWYEGSMDGTVP
ncbi:MAG: cupin domain-containing protein, partial [Halobacteriales archaeon]|nr:cupin domain-containing protein [Halobacteriales archaeon]